MKPALVLFLTLAAPIAHARDVNVAECFPATEAARKWPVKTIYLHGLFMPDGYDNSGFRALEAKNRVALEAAAKKLHFRIAVPVAPPSPTEKWREWNGLSLAKIEALAKEACHTNRLAPERALIGFSNGGYAARRIAFMSCQRTRAYSQIFALGAPKGTRPGRCDSQLVNRSTHEFPKVASLYQSLAYLNDAEAKTQFAESDSIFSDVSK